MQKDFRSKFRSREDDSVQTSIDFELLSPGDQKIQLRIQRIQFGIERIQFRIQKIQLRIQKIQFRIPKIHLRIQRIQKLTSRSNDILGSGWTIAELNEGQYA